MSLSIFAEGKEYISASRASKKIGYASDYIGQLCRAKKIPGKLIGRTWYVDFTSLLEHKKNRQLGRGKKLVVKKSDDLTSVEKSVLTLGDAESITGVGDEIPIVSELSPKLFFTYASDSRPCFPKLSKEGRYIEPVWTPVFVGQAVAFSLALIVAISTGFLTLENTNPSLARSTRQEVADIREIGKDFLVTLPYSVQHSVLNTLDNSQVAAVSFLDSFDNLFERVRASFHRLKQIALDKFFFYTPPSQLTYVAPAISSPPAQALTTPASSIDLGSLKLELKTELENYVRIQIDSILPRQNGASSPIVVYTSAPAVATADFESFRTGTVVPEIHYHITNQSNNDAERNSINLSNITDGGTFTNASISNSTFSGSLVSANSLSFGNATGTSATTTNLFSTNATFTNLSGVTLGLTDFSFTNATGTAATSTSLFGGQITGNQLRIGGTATSTINASGDLLVVGSTTLQNFTFINATGTNATTTNFFATTASSTNLFGTTGNFSTLAINTSASIPALSNLTSNGFVKTSGSNGTLSIDTTSYLSSYDAWTHPAYGGSATTSLLTLSGGFLNTAASSTIAGNLLITGNSTTTSATTTNFYSSSLTAGNATTTNFFSTTASSTNLYSSLLTVGGNGLVVDTSRNVGIGTTSPFGLLSVEQGTETASLWVGNTGSTTPSLMVSGVNGNGNVGIGTAVPAALLDIWGESTSEIRLYNAADAATPKIHFRNNAQGYDSEIYQDSLYNLAFAAEDGRNLGVPQMVITTSGLVGIGTTTPTWLLNPTSASASQLALSAGAGFSQWAFRNAGGNLYLATTTVAGTATSSVSSLSINSNGLLTLPSYGGVTGCAQFSTAGLLSNTGTACGTGGGTFSWTPGTYGATVVNATSTAIQLKGGLYASSTVRFGNTGIPAFFYDGAVGNLGLGTTSPFARLSVSGSTWLDSNIINFASTTASSLTLNYLASATSTIPNNKLYAWTIATSTTATPIFRIDTTSSGAGSVSATTSIRGGFVLDDGAFNYDSYAGVASVDSLSTGPIAFDDNAGILSWINMPVSTTTADIVMSYSAQIGDSPLLTLYAESLGTGGGVKNKRVGIGTTSPYALLSLATTTSQLVDLFAISTSTSGIVFKVDSYGRTYGDGAYSSPAADYAEYFYTKSVNLKSGEVVCVDVLENNAVKRCERGADNNVMGIVSTKPAVIGNYIKAAESDPSHYTIIGMLGQVDAFVSTENGPINIGDSLTSASTTPGFAMLASGGDSTVGIALEPMASSTGKIKVLISRRNKSLAVEEVESLVVDRVANMKIEDKVGQMIKQSVDSLNLNMSKELTENFNSLFDSLKIQTLASTTLSLGSRLDEIDTVFAPARPSSAGGSTSATSTADSFAGNFFRNLFTRFTEWLASAANGIGDFFANRVRTKELCVADDSGETCITKAQLDALIAGASVASSRTDTATSASTTSTEPIPLESASSTPSNSDSNGTSTTEPEPIPLETGSTTSNGSEVSNGTEPEPDSVTTPALPESPDEN